MSTINLLPDDYVERRSRNRVASICAVLFFVEMAAVLGAWIITERNIRHTMTVKDNVNDSYENAARMIARMQELEAQKKVMLRKANLTSALVERVPRSTLLAILTNALPKGTSLMQVDLETRRRLEPDSSRSKAGPASGKRSTTLTSEPKPASVKRPTTVVMEVTGLAGTDMEVAKFIANLARCTLVEVVDLVYSERREVNSHVMREFQVKLQLRSDADAIELKSQARRLAWSGSPSHAEAAQ